MSEEDLFVQMILDAMDGGHIFIERDDKGNVRVSGIIVEGVPGGSVVGIAAEDIPAGGCGRVKL